MKCKFVVGQKVVFAPKGQFVVAYNPERLPAERYMPSKGTIYTVAGMVPDADDEILLQLKEMPIYCGYDHRSFRPLQERPREADTNIRVFTCLLDSKALETVE